MFRIERTARDVMKKNDKYTYAPGSRTTDHESGHRTYDFKGTKLPSVTTILSRTKDQSYLDKWKAKVGYEEAERIKNLSSKRGTAMLSSWRNTYKAAGTTTLRKLANRLSRWRKRL